MQAETLNMLMEILKKLGCSEETMNAVKNDPAMKMEGEKSDMGDEKEDMGDEKEDMEYNKEKMDGEKEGGVAVVVAKKEETPMSPMKELLKSMLKSKGL